MEKGRLIRLPSDKETARAEEQKQNAYFPSVGRFFTSKNGKLMVTLNMFPDACFMLQEDKPKEDKPDTSNQW